MRTRGSGFSLAGLGRDRLPQTQPALDALQDASPFWRAGVNGRRLYLSGFRPRQALQAVDELKELLLQRLLAAAGLYVRAPVPLDLGLALPAGLVDLSGQGQQIVQVRLVLRRDCRAGAGQLLLQPVILAGFQPGADRRPEGLQLGCPARV
jgi:hypothetical protein